MRSFRRLAAGRRDCRMTSTNAPNQLVLRGQVDKPRHRTEAASANIVIMTVTAQPTRMRRMGLRQRPGRVVSLSAIPSSGHFEGANITASSSEQLRLTRIQTEPSKCLLPPLNRARTCRWLVWAGATAGAGKHVKYAADGVDPIIDLLCRVCGAE